MPSNRLSPDTPYLVLDERERDLDGAEMPVTTIFLTASRCPVACKMCDLHRNTLPGPTPRGAIPGQIDQAIAKRERRGWLKLYNSGNFFDPASIPPADYDQIASRCEGYSRIIVENHPRFGAERMLQFRDLITAPLEVAVGLETVQPRWLERLAKRMSRDEFDRYARFLTDNGIDLRVFLIVGVPGVTVREALRWARLSVRHAVAQGARHVSLIPARDGEGWGGEARQLPKLAASNLADLQRTAIQDVGERAIVTVDLWDVSPNDPGLADLQKQNQSQSPA